MDIHGVMQLLPHRYPFLMVDRVVKIEGNHIIGIKNVTINEPYFQGHFPGHPMMPGVLQLEAMAQVAGIVMLKSAENAGKIAYFMSAEDVKWRKPVHPGDVLVIEVELTKMRGKIGKAKGRVQSAGGGGQRGRSDLHADRTRWRERPLDHMIHPTAIIHPKAQIGADCEIGPYCVIGEHVVLGPGCRLAFARGRLTATRGSGRENEIFPFASIGLKTQDLKWKGGLTRTEIGDHNTFREYVTIHSATGDGEVTTVGSHNHILA